MLEVGQSQAWLVVCDARGRPALGGKRGACRTEVTGEDQGAESSLPDLFVWLTQYFGKKKKKISVSCPHLKLRRVPKESVPFSNNNNKANISVSLTACGALPKRLSVSLPPDWESSVLGRFLCCSKCCC